MQNLSEIQDIIFRQNLMTKLDREGRLPKRQSKSVEEQGVDMLI